MDKHNTPDEIIDALGGTSTVAELCEVGASAVSQWRTNGIPKTQLRFLKLARPDVFKALEKKHGAEAAAIKRNGGIRQHGDKRDRMNVSK